MTHPPPRQEFQTVHDNPKHEISLVEREMDFDGPPINRAGSPAIWKNPPATLSPICHNGQTDGSPLSGNTDDESLTKYLVLKRIVCLRGVERPNFSRVAPFPSFVVVSDFVQTTKGETDCQPNLRANDL